jgi:hypothetical protein
MSVVSRDAFGRADVPSGAGVTTSRSKAAGSAAERLVAHVLDGERVGQLGGPVDVIVEGYLDLQVKTLRSLPSFAAILKMLDAIPPSERLRGAVVVSRPGTGKRAVRTITFDLDDFATWHAK